MHKLLGCIPAVLTILLGILFLSTPQPVKAADVRTGNSVIITENEQNLKDLYLFGKSVEVNAPVTNDIVAAGGTVTISNAVSNSVIAAGGNVTIHGKVGNTVRVAGGNVTIDGPVNHDLVVAGGNVTVSKNASINGDLLIAGGQLIIEGPIKGKILMSGGDITLDSAVGDNVYAGQVGTLTLGPQAKINGNLTYSSPQPLTQQSGSVVKGQTTYHHVEKPHKQQSASSWFGFAFYQLLSEIIISLLLIYFLKNGFINLLTSMRAAPWKGLGIGFAYVILTPIVSLILLILFPLGLASFLLYFLILIISVFIRDIFAGWLVMRWWDNRNKKAYMLDWKAAVVGPISMLLINLIPVLGWLVSAIICLIGIGALVENLTGIIPRLQTVPKKK